MNIYNVRDKKVINAYTPFIAKKGDIVYKDGIGSLLLYGEAVKAFAYDKYAIALNDTSHNQTVLAVIR